MSNPPRTPLIDSLRRQLQRTDLEDAERLALAEALSRRLADAVEDHARQATDDALSLIGTLTRQAEMPPSALASAARGLGEAHYQLRVEQERNDRQTDRVLRTLRGLAERPGAPPAARLALADALEQEVSALCWADDWAAAQRALAELRENAEQSGRRPAYEALARALCAAVCCACTLRPDWGGRRDYVEEVRRLAQADPHAGALQVALAETLTRELVVAIEVGQHILAHTLLMEVRQVIGRVGATPLGQLPEALCAAVLRAVRREREALADACLEQVRALARLPDAVLRHGDQLSEAFFCCFVWAGQRDEADRESLLGELRTLAQEGGGRTARYYLAKALYNRHHEAGDQRDWPACDALLEELRWLDRAGDDRDLTDIYSQALGNAHYDAWSGGQVERAERHFQDLLRLVRRHPATLNQRLEWAKALHRKHADAIEADDDETAVELLAALQALGDGEPIDDAIRFEVGDALAMHYLRAVAQADVGRARVCRVGLETLVDTAHDDEDLRGLLEEIIS